MRVVLATLHNTAIPDYVYLALPDPLIHHTSTLTTQEVRISPCCPAYAQMPGPLYRDPWAAREAWRKSPIFSNKAMFRCVSLLFCNRHLSNDDIGACSPVSALRSLLSPPMLSTTTFSLPNHHMAMPTARSTQRHLRCRNGKEM